MSGRNGGGRNAARFIGGRRMGQGNGAGIAGNPLMSCRATQLEGSSVCAIKALPSADRLSVSGRLRTRQQRQEWFLMKRNFGIHAHACASCMTNGQTVQRLMLAAHAAYNSAGNYGSVATVNDAVTKARSVVTNYRGDYPRNRTPSP